MLVIFYVVRKPTWLQWNLCGPILPFTLLAYAHKSTANTRRSTMNLRHCNCDRCLEKICDFLPTCTLSLALFRQTMLQYHAMTQDCLDYIAMVDHLQSANCSSHNKHISCVLFSSTNHNHIEQSIHIISTFTHHLSLYMCWQLLFTEMQGHCC